MTKGSDALRALSAGGKPAMARALTLLERGLAPRAASAAARDAADEAAALLDAAWAAPKGPTVGLTGPPGVGKSTLVDALIRAQRGRGRGVGVIAVDPSSKRSGGALLGDRTRLSTDPEDDQVFVRSMAARDRLGGLSSLAYPSAVLMRAVYALAVIETVGVGQSETEIADAADVTVFCVQPGSGDSLQFMKAGVMETPDLVLVTKADLGEPARRAAADAAGALSLASAAAPPEVLLISARAAAEGEDAALQGVAAALETMERLAAAVGGFERRAAQARAWIEESVRGAYGAEGLALARRLQLLDAADERPFATRSCAMATLGGAFDAAAERLRAPP